MSNSHKQQCAKNEQPKTRFATYMVQKVIQTPM